jgi:hypothetical protein
MSHIQQLAKTGEQKQQPARADDSYGLLACVVISIFLIAWITLVTKSLNFGVVVFLFALPWVLLRTGGIVTTALRFPSFFALDFLLGATVISVAVMIWKLFVPVSLWVSLVVLLVAVASIPNLLPRHRRDPLSVLGLLSLILSLVAATGWSQDLIFPTTSVDGTVVFKPWSDFFIHATIMARSLGAETFSQVGNYEWKGFPAVFYHYASYSIPICLAKAGSLPAYATVVGFWAPFGSFLTGLASYALGRAIWSQSAGLAALIGTFLLPDAGLLNIAHPNYGYFWLQHISPAGLYAVAVAGTALILVVLGARKGQRTWIISGVAVAALIVFFKAQIFAAAFPLLLGFAVLAWPPRSRWNWVVLGACVVAGIVLLPIADRFYVAPNMRFDFSDNDWYWKTLADMARGTRVESWYDAFRVKHTFPSHLPQAIGLLLINALGIFVILAPLVWISALRRKRWQASHGISLAAVVILLLMTFGLSRSGTAENAYEFIQHPFVWAYWLVGSLTAGGLFSWLASRRPQFWTRTLVVTGIGLTLVPICYGVGLQRGKWSGGSVRSGLPVDRGLIDCANYIRSQAPSDAVVQDSDLDKFSVLAGLAERPSFAARVDMWIRQSKAFRESPYREQLRKLQRLQQATSIGELQGSVRETGIRWYVAHPGYTKVWPAEFRDQPAFESNGYRVYDLQRCFDLHG